LPNEPTTAGSPGWLTEPVTPKAVRDRHERLVLSTVRNYGPLASSDVARRTALSAQTASVITRALEAEGLLSRGEPVRGKVGKPSVPLTLAADGAYAFGLRVGRRVADLVLLDLSGTVLGARRLDYPYPTPDRILGFLRGALPSLTRNIAGDRSDRIVGLGIGSPFELWNWLDLVRAPKAEMMAWKGFSYSRALAPITPLPVFVGNDATLACFGELAFGNSAGLVDFGYFYVGAFAGGGLVLNGRLVTGPSGNAGAMGPIMVRDPARPDNQLLHHASLYVLETMLEEAGLSIAPLRGAGDSWPDLGPQLDRWIDRAAGALATATISMTAILDVPAVIVDGRFPPEVRVRMVAAIRARLNQVDGSGLRLPKILPGTLGARAGALGAAYRPIQERYFAD